jgi:hypothetical protein
VGITQGGQLYLADTLLDEVYIDVHDGYCGATFATRTHVELAIRSPSPHIALSATIWGPSVEEWQRLRYDGYTDPMKLFEMKVMHFADRCRCNRMFMLGPGYVCKHCGNYCPSGCGICWRCGGQAELENYVKPSRFPFVMANKVTDANTSWRIGCRVELQATTEDEAEVLPWLAGDTPHTMPNGCELETGYYLCHKCGGAVLDGQVCPGCGGTRIPMQEIVRLDQTCHYCHSTMRGGVVCPDCGAHIAGLTVKDVVRQEQRGDDSFMEWLPRLKNRFG